MHIFNDVILISKPHIIKVASNSEFGLTSRTHKIGPPPSLSSTDASILDNILLPFVIPT